LSVCGPAPLRALNWRQSAESGDATSGFLRYRLDDFLQDRRNRDIQALALFDKPSCEVCRDAHAAIVRVSLGQRLERLPQLIGGLIHRNSERRIRLFEAQSIISRRVTVLFDIARSGDCVKEARAS